MGRIAAPDADWRGRAGSVRSTWGGPPPPSVMSALQPLTERNAAPAARWGRRWFEPQPAPAGCGPQDRPVGAVAGC